MKQWYILMGVTDKMLNDWLKDLRNDIEFFVSKKNKVVIPMIKLSWFEALKMNYQMKKWNRENHYKTCLRLERI